MRLEKRKHLLNGAKSHFFAAHQTAPDTRQPCLWWEGTILAPAKWVAGLKLPWRNMDLAFIKYLVILSTLCLQPNREKAPHFLLYSKIPTNSRESCFTDFKQQFLQSLSVQHKGTSLAFQRVLLHIRTAHSFYNLCQYKINLLPWSVHQIWVSVESKTQAVWENES